MTTKINAILKFLQTPHTGPELTKQFGYWKGALRILVDTKCVTRTKQSTEENRRPHSLYAATGIAYAPKRGRPAFEEPVKRREALGEWAKENAERLKEYQATYRKEHRAERSAYQRKLRLSKKGPK